ncbi:hypothetical protein ACHHYP_15924 [Achlya hypogyna]|uniref:Transmembrane protein n=1 Tax=Achlya hypogyna TaxID=1202772 RepID=A0A1V9Y9V1_ACHHY|nr:hypothetical protein ACHHYP_15924 [Achlya hypogyna]
MRSDAAFKFFLCAYVFFVVILAVPFVLVPLLICLKVDGLLVSSWAAALTPLWVSDAFFLLLVYVLTLIKDEDANKPAPENDKSRESAADQVTTANDGAIVNYGTTDASATTDTSVALAVTPVTYLTKRQFYGGILEVIFHIGVALRLDGVLRCPWTLTLVPFALADVVNGLNPASIGNTLQYLLIFLKLDGVLHGSWATMLLPLWIILVPAVLFMVGAIAYVVNEERDLKAVVLGIVGLVGVATVAATPILLAQRLDGTRSYSALEACLPYFGACVASIAAGAGLVVMVGVPTALEEDATGGDAA